MKIHQQGFVLGTNWTYRDTASIVERNLLFVSRRIRPDRELGQLRAGGVRSVYDHSCIQSDQAFVRRQQRIDVDFLDPALLGNQSAEFDQQVLETCEVDRFSSPHSLERRKDFSLLDKTP